MVDPANATQSARLNSHYMLHSMAHWQPMVNGYSGIIPPRHERLFRILTAFPDTASLGELEALGVRYAVVHREFYGDAEWARFLERAATFPERLHLEAETSDGRLYALTARPAAPLSPRPGPRSWNRLAIPCSPTSSRTPGSGRRGVRADRRRVLRGHAHGRGPRVDGARPRGPGAPVRRAAAAPRPADRGRPRSPAPRRDPGLQPPLPPSLDGAPGLGAAAGRGLDGVARRGAQPVRRGVGDVAGGHDPRDAGRALDVRPGRARPRGGRHVHLGRPRPRSPRSSRRGRPPCRTRGRRGSGPAAGRAPRRARALRGGASGGRAGPRHRQRRRRAVAGLPDGRGGPRGRASTDQQAAGGGSWRWWRPRARPPPGRSTTSRRSAGCARRGGSGCTSTAPTGPRRSSRRRTASG